MTATDYASDWREAGACLSADPDLFYPISTTGLALAQIAKARTICSRCEVRRQCLEFAMETGDMHGIWGGTTPEERRRARRRKRAGGSRSVPDLARVS
ncbi:MAG: WhiB family transcriptional regulator [Streptosporangiaceae bacterium]|nr:WhiB family transcriptional regulator [Streptosporangiaceae bacterium]MBV9854907.1 WhiB family transcriptional regulator [Streptosporangiaceae bacterium]